MEANLVAKTTENAKKKTKKRKIAADGSSGKKLKSKKRKNRKSKKSKAITEGVAVGDVVTKHVVPTTTPRKKKKKSKKSKAVSNAHASDITTETSLSASESVADTAPAPVAQRVDPSPAASSSKKKQEKDVTFASLGLKEVLCESCDLLKWANPTPIQRDAIPPALAGKDIIGVAETGSGKTGAFALPLLHMLLDNPQRLFAVILAPVRELVIQIADTIDALGASIDVKCLTIVGGVDSMTQSIALARKPHVICATPGRLVDHLENTKGFNLRTIKYLVLDEADRMLSMDFEEELNQILEVIPTERTTMLFSATMTSKVAKLQRAALRDPVKVEVSSKYQTVKTLIQNYLFIPEKYKDCYLVYILNEFAGQTMLIFTKTCNECERVTLMLRSLGFNATCLHGRMQQAARLGALNKFKAGTRNILSATDVASRGLDIPTVDMVLNFSIPSNSKDYVHRVGRTARAGRAGRALNFVTQYDVQDYQRIEKDLNKRLEAFKVDEEVVLVLLERVLEAQRFAAIKMREANKKKKGGKHGRRGKRR